MQQINRKIDIIQLIHTLTHSTSFLFLILNCKYSVSKINNKIVASDAPYLNVYKYYLLNIFVSLLKGINCCQLFYYHYIIIYIYQLL